MQTPTKNPTVRHSDRQTLWALFCRPRTKCLLLLSLSGALALSACGGSHPNASQVAPVLSGNWQFTMASHTDGTAGDPSFSGGLQGGFLLQNNGAISGSILYAVSSSLAPQTACATGSASITGTISGAANEQTLTLAAIAGSETITLVGMLSPDGSTMSGTYTPSGTTCGYTETNPEIPQWSATLVPDLTGPIQGSFQSTGGTAGLNEQNFLVSGTLTQAVKTGAASATVTGSLNFSNATTNLSDYPCFGVADVTGQISGNSVSLQIVDADGTALGQIGPLSGSSLQAVTYDPTQNGYALQSLSGTGYAVYAPGCGGGSITNPADSGTVCLGVNTTTACQQPITLTPPSLAFSSQTIGSHQTTQTVTITNISSAIVGGLTLALSNGCPGSGSCLDSFTETDTCGADSIASPGQPFTLDSQQSCVATIMYSPQQACGSGISTGHCLTATLALTSANSDEIFTVPITGGVSVGAASNMGTETDAKGSSRAAHHHAQIE